MKYTILILLLALAGISLATKVNITDLNSLSVPQKLGLLALSSLQPQRFGDELNWKTLFNEEDTPWVDYFFIDFRTLLTQSFKVGETAPLPELDWFGIFDFCVISLPCVYFEFTLKTNRTSMTGQKRTTSVNEITPTTFKNTFRVPSFVWHSPDFLFELDDRSSGRYLYRNMRLSVNNLRLETAFHYEYVEGIGIQISNLDIDMGIIYLRALISNVVHIYPNGIPLIYPPILTDWAIHLRDIWPEYKEGYLESLQFKINCLLSDTRNDPEGCRNTAWISDDYYKFNILQWIQTIGLGSMNHN